MVIVSMNDPLDNQFVHEQCQRKLGSVADVRIDSFLVRP